MRGGLIGEEMRVAVSAGLGFLDYSDNICNIEFFVGASGVLGVRVRDTCVRPVFVFLLGFLETLLQSHPLLFGGRVRRDDMKARILLDLETQVHLLPCPFSGFDRIWRNLSCECP